MKTKTHTLGLPSLGPNRELKKHLEAFWRGDLTKSRLEQEGRRIRDFYRLGQSSLGLDTYVYGDFTYYDRVLDLCGLFGLLPCEADRDPLENIFDHARGNASKGIRAAVMTKWFDTNYHYLVPPKTEDWNFVLQENALQLFLSILEEAPKGFHFTLIGPLTFYYLLHPGRASQASLKELHQLQEVYLRLINILRDRGLGNLYLEEPILVLDPLPEAWGRAFSEVYQCFEGGTDILVATYFGSVDQNTKILLELPVKGIHLDFRRNRHILEDISHQLSDDQILSLGVVDARSPWCEDSWEVVSELNRSGVLKRKELWLAPDANLQFLPWSLENEDPPEELKPNLAFAKEKLQALVEIADLIHSPYTPSTTFSSKDYLPWKGKDLGGWRGHGEADPKIRGNTAARLKHQSDLLRLQPFPVTTIGSFPQTDEIRRQRRLFRSGNITQEVYENYLKEEITGIIRQQEQIGVDVLVHGEPERTDMVSFFTEFLSGVWQPKNGWVRSYGSRCVRPPVIHATPNRVSGLGTKWIKFAQSLTEKPVKGMLTGPVTLTKWSFTPPFLEQKMVARAFAEVLRQEVLDLEAAGIKVIQIDEPAFREILPLRRSKWDLTLEWSAGAFRRCFQGVDEGTQIHTHMCYSDFGDIHQGIEAMDADVISIETSRNRGSVLEELDSRTFSAALGPGVWDIHSPLRPNREDMQEIITKAVKALGSHSIWINPDCGLKTRKSEEIIKPLQDLVDLARSFRNSHSRTLQL